MYRQRNRVRTTLVAVIIVAAVSIAAYMRHQHIQAELAAQQNVMSKISKGFGNWKDDLGRRIGDVSGGVRQGYTIWSQDFGKRVDDLTGGFASGFTKWRDELAMRLGDLNDGIGEKTGSVRNAVGGAWGLVAFIVTAIFDIVGNLHIMIPVAIVYFITGFFGNIRTRIATLIAVLIAVMLATNIGIVAGSILGIIAIFVLVFGEKITRSARTAAPAVSGDKAAQPETERDNSQ